MRSTLPIDDELTEHRGLVNEPHPLLVLPPHPPPLLMANEPTRFASAFTLLLRTLDAAGPTAATDSSDDCGVYDDDARPESRLVRE